MENDDPKAQARTEKISIEANSTKNLLNFHHSVKLKYVKLGYHYLISHGMYLLVVPLLGIALVNLSTLTVDDLFLSWDHLKFNLVSLVLYLIVFLATLYFMTRPRKVYLDDFACYKPKPDAMCSNEIFMENSRSADCFTDESLDFQKRILERSGLGQKTYFPEAIMRVPAVRIWKANQRGIRKMHELLG